MSYSWSQSFFAQKHTANCIFGMFDTVEGWSDVDQYDQQGAELGLNCCFLALLYILFII